jgi:hypothetical protein|tara:strand:+ start:181 stop:504 length:324 start_codon:yes stop_codon:yes gene_type:complete
MANAYKILAQHAGGTTPTTYASPADTETIISSIVVANRVNAANTFRVAVYPSGGSLGNSSYLAYDVSVAANDVITMTLGVTLAAGDTLYLYASDTDTSINAFGTQIS